MTDTTITETTLPTLPAWINLEAITSTDHLNEMSDLAAQVEAWFDSGLELLHRAGVARANFEDAIPSGVDKLFNFITDRVPEYRHLNSVLMMLANRALMAAGEDAHFTLSEADLEALGDVVNDHTSPDGADDREIMQASLKGIQALTGIALGWDEAS